MIYNVITVAFGALRKATSLPINYRYDTGQILKIKGLNLPENYVVDFCNEGDSVTKPMVGNADGVQIPDEYLQTGKKVKAYIVLVGEDNSQTRYEITIPINQRPARSDIEPTPEEQSTIDTLIAAMNTAVAESEESADRAGDAADRAETAVSHYPKIEDGNWYVWNPETGAYEDTGIQAEGEDGVGIQSATLNADFTLTLTFTDGTSYTTPSIRGEPGQSGQDGVSPTITVTAITGGHRVEITDADGTKTFNVMDGQTGATPDIQIGTVTTLPPGSEATAEITGTPEQPRLNLGIPEGQKGDPGEVTLAQLDTALADKAPIITDTASGAIASFPDGADGLPLKSLVATIEPVQAGSGDPSPDNVRPISGRTSATVTRTGKNLCNVESFPDGTYWGASFQNLVDIVNALPVGTYTFSQKEQVKTLPENGAVQHGRPYITAMVNGSQVPVLGYSVTTDNSPTVGKVYLDTGTFTITEDNKGKINHVYLYCDSSVHSGTGRGLYSIYDIQIELGSTATSYEPYHGETYEITFPSEAGTVYGRTLDVTNGVLTVDRAMVDLGTLTWAYNGSVKFFQAEVSNVAPVTYTGIPNAICSSYAAGSIATVRDGSKVGFALNQNGYCYVRDPAYTDAATFKAAMSGAQLCYELATPITYTLPDVTMLETVLGTNNIWADAGPVDVEYRADTKLYLEKLTAPTEDDLIADHAITSGSFFMVGNTLYKATAAIANGATITPGTNATRLSLADALNLLS